MNVPLLQLFASQGLLPVNSLTWLGTAGRFLIILAGICAAVSIASAFFKREKLAVNSLHASSVSFWLAFVSLVTLFVTSQFQFVYVQRHSAYDHEMPYKFAGTWSGQEGSFLLWAICSALFVSLAVRAAGKYKLWFSGVSSIFLLCLAGILSFESPFNLNPPGTDIHDGFGMPATLLNYWVVIHPPTIFLGFGALTALFSWAIAAMLHRDLDTWIDQIRPWALVALTLTGVGLCMGGFWAYETLSFGGFWVWDPVENASFVPWVMNAVFIHGIIVQKARKKWQLHNIFYGALPFLAFVYGTFLTRSGFLGDTSVHSFAKMDRTALWILVAIGLASIGGLLAVYFPTAKWFKAQAPAEPKADGFWTKDTFYAYGNWLLIALGLIAAFGMSVPLIQSLKGEMPRVVDEQLYNTVTSFPFLPLVILMGIAPFLTWRKEGVKNFTKYLVNLLAATIATVGFLLLWLKWGGHEVGFGPLIVAFPGEPADPAKATKFLMKFGVYTIPWILALTGICAFSVYANLTRGYQLFRQNRLSSAGMITHIGVVLTVAGLIFSHGLEKKVDKITVHPSKTMKAFGYNVNYIDHTSGFGDRHNKLKIEFSKPGQKFIAQPALYYTPGQDGRPQENVWPYIHSNPLYDIYIVARSFQFNDDGTPDFGGSNPQSLLPGQTGVFFETFAKYEGMETEGTPGTFGAKFTAVVTVTDHTGERTIRPYVKLLGPGELERPIVDIGNGMGIYLDSINAADKSANIVFKYLTPAFPVEIYYKPLTILVWWGVGIMAFGGTLAAFYRRNKRITPSSESTATQETKETDATQNPVEV